jgi:hypothetical protein
MGVRPCGSREARSAPAAPVHRRGVPGQLGQEEPEPLEGRRLRPHDRFAPDQPGQSLVAIAGQQQPLRVLPRAAPLGERAEEIVELGHVLFERPGGGWTGPSLGRGGTSALDRCTRSGRAHQITVRGR